MKTLNRLLAYATIFGGALLLARLLPFTAGFAFTPTSWGWLAYITGMLLYLIGFRFLKSRIAASLTDENKSYLHVAAEEVARWLCIPVGATVACTLLPAYFTVTNGLGGWVVAVIMAVAFGVEKAAQLCINRYYEAD